MKCPHCKTEIDHLVVTSRVYHTVYFKEGTNKIDNDTWYHLGDGDADSYECPECDKNVGELIDG